MTHVTPITHAQFTDANPDVSMEIDRRFTDDDCNAQEVCDAVIEADAVLAALADATREVPTDAYRLVRNRIRDLASKICAAREAGMEHPPVIEPTLKEWAARLASALKLGLKDCKFEERIEKRGDGTVAQHIFFGTAFIGGVPEIGSGSTARGAFARCLDNARERMAYEAFKQQKIEDAKLEAVTDAVLHDVLADSALTA